MAEVLSLNRNTPNDAAAIAADPAAFVRDLGEGQAELALVIENMHCGGCVQRIERALLAVPGVETARANLTTKRVAVGWRKSVLEAGEVMRVVADLGFSAVPFDPGLVQDSGRAEEAALLKAMAIAGFAAANVMLLSVSVWAGAFSQDMGPATRDLLHWVSALIAVPAVGYAGRPFFNSAVRALAVRTLNMDVPISLAVVLAVCMSLFETATGGEHAYFDASVTLLFFLLIGRYLDRRARARAASAAEQLLLLAGQSATLLHTDGQRRVVPLAALRAGMRVEVAPGDRVPADGIVVRGHGEIDTALVTGESLPHQIRPGDRVFAGTLNLISRLEVEIAAAGADTLLAEIVRLMERAEKVRGRYVALADRAARLYAPAVHLLAAVSFLGWWLVGGLGWQPSLLIAVAVLIVTCPCALGLAVPVVQVVASGRLFADGVLVKAGDALERLAVADTVVFDKTGTLTLGRPELANLHEVAADDLRRAATLAVASRHPLARALVAAAGTVAAAEGVKEERGMGLAAMTDAGEIRLGNRIWCGLDEAAADNAGTEMWLCCPQRSPVRFLFRDRPRPDAVNVVTVLKARGLDVILLSGDRNDVVAETAAELGIEHWRGECRPDDKVAAIEALAAEGRRVAMVGDGLNDAPALRSAAVSLAPASGSDIARTAADVVLPSDRLDGLLAAVDLARRARRAMLQNFALALAYNAVAVPLAMAGLVTPLIAAAAMSSSSLAVTLNALRLKVGGRAR